MYHLGRLFSYGLLWVFIWIVGRGFALADAHQTTAVIIGGILFVSGLV